MRTFIIGLMVFLAACNQGTTQVPYSDPTLVAKVDSLTQALADATHVEAQQAQKISELRIVGHTFTAEKLGRYGIATDALPISQTCSDMGVLIGFVNSNGQPANALSAIGQVFEQCNGYLYSTLISDGSIFPAPRIFFDGPCVNGLPTGNALEWESGGGGYNASTLQNGVVFSSPVDGTILMVRAGQTPQPILIQSVWVTSNPACQSDVEVQPMYIVEPNDFSVTQISSDGVGSFHLGAP